MYIKYAYKNTATAAQVLADIVSIICNNSALTGLSASYDAGNSSALVTTLSSNWAVYDASASATSKVIRSLNADGSTYKYAEISLSAGAALVVKTWESWNSGTHAGTNQGSMAAAVQAPTFTMTGFGTGGYVMILACNKYFFIFAPQNNVYHKMGVIEFSHESPAMSSSYPFHALYCPGQTGTAGTSALDSFSSTARSGALALTRIKDPVASGDLTGSSIIQQFVNVCWPATGATSVKQTNSGGGALDTSEVPYLITFPYVLSAASRAANALGLFMIGQLLGDIKCIPATLPTFATGDEVTIGGVLHVLFQENAGAPSTGLHALAIPKL